MIVPFWLALLEELNLAFKAYLMALSTRQPFEVPELFELKSASITLPLLSTVILMTTLPPSMHVYIGGGSL